MSSIAGDFNRIHVMSGDAPQRESILCGGDVSNDAIDPGVS